LAFPFLGRGIVPDGAASWFLPRVVGISWAMEWCTTARTFGPDEALAAGLVRSVDEPDQVLAKAYALAEEIAAGSAPVSAAMTRRLLWSSLGFEHPVLSHAVESRAISELGNAPDAHEGVTAFLEKRRPQWSMRPSTDTPDWFPSWSDPEYRPA
jgi:enoyl-CoA hydratase/carnithine racemase